MGENPRKRTGRIDRHEKASRKIVDRVFDDLFKANQSIRQIARRYCNVMEQSAEGVAEVQALALDPKKAGKFIDRLINTAVKEGTSRGAVQKKILEYLQRRLAGEDFITIKGKDGIDRKYNLRDYAETVARTNLREAQTEATKEAAREYGHDLVEVPEKGGSCEDCQEYEGKVYSLSGDDPDYPMLQEEPPFHPRCRHYLRVTSRNILRNRSEG